MSENQVTLVDQNQIKFNMTMTSILLIIGFLINSWIPVTIVIVCQISGAAGLSFAPYRLLFKHAAIPLGIVKPKKIPDHHTPHRFASLVGGIFNLIGLIFLLLGMVTAGWIFIAIVFVLSILNLFMNFCGGCFIYYNLNKFGVPGFTKSPVSAV